MKQTLSFNNRFTKKYYAMNRTLFFTLASLLLLASCERIYFEDVEIGKLYVGTCQGKDYMVLVEQAEEGASEGRIYYDNGELVAGDNPFRSDLKKNGEGNLWVGNEEGQSLTKVTLKNNSLHGFVNDEEFELQLVPDVEQQFKPLYKDCCYHVSKERGRVYARNVSGYWMSYPDRNEGFAKTYLRKSLDLISTRDWDLDMDLYFPTENDGDRLRPLLVLIHGGAFYNGDKGDKGYPEMGKHFAERGYVVASINYRLGFRSSIDNAGFRALQDAYAAICYLKENAEEFGIDTTLIFTAGTSAGAITALNLAFMRDQNRPKAVSDEEGLINKVSGEYGQPFRVKAVANMWGAVHDLSMLSNSTETAIISFHGDEDHIVPYEYGCPFDSVLNLETVDNILYQIAKPPVNQLVFHPMQGSKAIHDKALTIKRENGEPMRSEMHTVHGGSIHHLHKDEYGRLTNYFYDTILPATTRFFYEELVGGVTVGLAQSERDGRWFNAYGTDNVAELYWKVEGGVVVRNSDNNRVKVLLFGNAQKHAVKICGKYKNGVEFEETITL